MDTILEHGTCSVEQDACIYIHGGQIVNYWEDLAPWFAGVIKTSYGELTAIDIFNAVMREEMQVFVVTRKSEIIFCAATKLRRYPQYCTAFVVHVCGNFSAFKRFNEHFEIWAAANGALYAETDVSPAMERWMNQQKMGYKTTYRTMRKKLERTIQ